MEKIKHTIGNFPHLYKSHGPFTDTVPIIKFKDECESDFIETKISFVRNKRSKFYMERTFDYDSWNSKIYGPCRHYLADKREEKE